MNDYKIFKLLTYEDHRGFFLENYSRVINERLGLQFKQDNLSFSHTGVVRGLHYQWDKPMGKLVSVIKGSIIDYIVDIRVGSPTFGQVHKSELNDKDRYCLWIPAGYAHGFEVLEDSYVLYKCTEFYNSDAEGSINIYDLSLNFCLATNTDEAIMSEKDTIAQSFSEYMRDPKFYWSEK